MAKHMVESQGLTLAEKAVVEILRAAPSVQVLFETVTSFEDLEQACQMARRVLGRRAGGPRARAKK